MEIQIPIEIRCGNCNEKALVASGDTLTDDSMVTCSSCGARIGPWSTLKKQASDFCAEEIKKKLSDAFGDNFKMNNKETLTDIGTLSGEGCSRECKYEYTRIRKFDDDDRSSGEFIYDECQVLDHFDDWPIGGAYELQWVGGIAKLTKNQNRFYVARS